MSHSEKGRRHGWLRSAKRRMARTMRLFRVIPAADQCRANQPGADQSVAVMIRFARAFERHAEVPGLPGIKPGQAWLYSASGRIKW